MKKLLVYLFFCFLYATAFSQKITYKDIIGTWHRKLANYTIPLPVGIKFIDSTHGEYLALQTQRVVPFTYSVDTLQGGYSSSSIHIIDTNGIFKKFDHWFIKNIHGNKDSIKIALNYHTVHARQRMPIDYTDGSSADVIVWGRKVE